jgi:hypothetical protein
MSHELDPKVGRWYRRLDDEQLFKVVSIDEDDGVVEIKTVDGEIEELDSTEWVELDLEGPKRPKTTSSTTRKKKRKRTTTDPRPAVPGTTWTTTTMTTTIGTTMTMMTTATTTRIADARRGALRSHSP